MRDKRNPVVRAAWRKANQEKIRAYQRVWQAGNREKHSEKCKKWYQKNKEKVLAHHRIIKDKMRASCRAYYARNVDKLREQGRKYHHANKERLSGYLSKWRKDNPDKLVANTRRRFASKLNATPKWANDFFIKEIYHLARLRTKMLGYQWHVDHIVPLRSKQVCGLHVENNLQVIPARENLSKHNTYWPNMP